MEYECIIISLIYVRRLIKKSNGQFALLKENWKGVILSCIILSNKVWDDFHMQNLDYCYVFNGLTIERVNSLELQLLLSIDNRCNVSPSVYAQTHFEIQAMITLTNIESGKSKMKKPKNIFSSNFAKVHAATDEDADDTATVQVEHPSPYHSFKFNDDHTASASVAHEKEDEDSPENSTHLSVDEYATYDNSDKLTKIPAPVFTEGIDPEDEFPAARKKLIHSIDLDAQRRQLRVLIHYEENSLIKSPCMTMSGKTGSQADSQTSINSRGGNNFKLLKQRSRKSLRGPGVFNSSPMTPIVSKSVVISKWSCFPFSLCMGKMTQDVI